ncbi:hypothetical protein GCM10009744_47750 [Kribbella alba]|uniref:Uncharacterized protein n=1 Tax=Kribbella alba TaxID=190197 RepID=A0ABN2FKV9_9ACTN
MGEYKKPNKQVHRGFSYLDDETVINSLSAIEAGKIDEVVAKIVNAKHGGGGGGVGVPGLKVEGEYKSDTSLEEEMVRTRTRFSVFEIWYGILQNSKALGRFDGWAPGALVGVQPGDTVEIRAAVSVAPLQTMLRLFYWFADQAKSQGSLFSQSGPELKTTKETERHMRSMFEGQHGQVPAK